MSSQPLNKLIEVGTQVRANYFGEGRFWHGQIVKIASDDKYTIRYEDNSFEIQVPRSRIIGKLHINHDPELTH